MDPENTSSLTLGPLDHIAPRNITQSIIYLSLKQGVSPQDAFDSLRLGLHRTLLQSPWLGGLVRWQPQDAAAWRPGQLEIRHAPKQALLDSNVSTMSLRMNQIDTSTTYADLKDAGFPLDPFSDETLLWSSPFKPNFELGEPVFAAQANFLTGGCLLAMAIAAPVSDGTAMLTLTKLWADNCNASATAPIQSLSPEAFDRMVLDSMLERTRNSSKQAVEHCTNLERLVGIGASKNSRCRDEAVCGSEAKDGPSHNMVPKLFYIPQSGYTALRKQSVLDSSGVELIGNDLICAFIWRSVMRAFAATSTQPLPQNTTVSIPFDARPNLTPSSQTSYVGNMNFETTFQLPLETIISPATSITSLAKTIRTHANNNSNVHTLLAAYDLLRSQPEYGTQQIRVTWMPPTEGSVGIQSPIVLPFNDTRFSDSIFGNSGRVESFRPMMGAPNRKYRTCFVVPRKPHGGLEFVMTLNKEEIAWLQEDKEFNECAFAL